jgi:arsenite methyltransferase
MIARARKNASNKSLETPQVAFVQCLLTEPLPIRSGTIDCILSNCVINLLPLPGKASLLQETFKVLKPGGRIVLDDVSAPLIFHIFINENDYQIVAKKHLPDDIRSDLAAHVGCIAGALELDAYKGLIIDAGFQGSPYCSGCDPTLTTYYRCRVCRHGW